jgi:glycogen synthase
VRILTIGNMYPPHHLGGYELTWRSSVEHLRQAGHTVRVLTTDYRNPRPDPTLAEGPDVHRELRWYWRDHDFPRLSGFERLALERHNARVFDRHVRALRPDAIGWWAMGGMSLSLIERARRRGVPSVAVVGDDWLVYGPQVDAWTRALHPRPVLARLIEQVVRVPTRIDFADMVFLFNSDAVRQAARSARPDVSHTKVAHPGIDTELFHPAPEREWDWRLLYVGRLDERKGVDTAVEALALLPPDARLTVLGAGDDAYAHELRNRCGRLGVEDRVDFDLRPREQLPAAYAAADVLLFPVRWAEPWGLVPLEAMAVGTPVIATGTGGSGEYLRDEDNALVVGSGAGPEEVAAAVRRLAADPGLRARLRDGGLTTAASFTERAYNERIAAALASAAQHG